ncbi:MAG: hypothetical protein RIS44_2327 [Pseudomonadota bacterium]|jgi:hypothetical protein
MQIPLLLACAALGLGLAAQHPLWPTAMVSLWLLWTMLLIWRPQIWLWALPAALPMANLSPWTGWLVFEEFDLLVLATLSALLLHQRLSHRSALRPTAPPLQQLTIVTVLLALGLGSAAWGMHAAGIWRFNLFASHEDSLWALRASKAMLWAVLLWPWLRQGLMSAPHTTLNRIGLGMVAGLSVVSLVSINERLAYPGLTDFVSHYRTTALFWEMHVGGAAIDAYLALATPFAVWALWRYRGMAWGFSSLLAVCVTYACLTTFARGVYLAVLVGLLVWLLARYAQLTAQGKVSPGMRWLARACWALLALCACAGLLLLSFEAVGTWGAVWCALILAAVAAWLKWRAQHQGWRLPASLVLGTVLLIEIAAVLGGDSFMNKRLEEGPADLDSRMAHWQHGLGLLQTPRDWLIGFGAGRFPAVYAASDPKLDFSGRLRLAKNTTTPHAILEGPRHRDDLGGLFSATQRVPLTSKGRYSVRLNLQAAQPTSLLLRVCEKHLLYDRNCQNAVVRVPASTDNWTELTGVLRGPRLDAGAWWAPRSAVFSVAVLEPQKSVALRGVELVSPQGQSLLRNGDFSAGLAHWFPRAQRFYLPWHTDNLMLELLIERGVLGLMAFAALLVAAVRGLIRALALPDEQGGGLVPVLLASVASVLAVGMVSSVLDVPRIGFLLFFFLMLGLALGEKPSAANPNTDPLGPVQKTPAAL